MGIPRTRTRRPKADVSMSGRGTAYMGEPKSWNMSIRSWESTTDERHDYAYLRDLYKRDMSFRKRHPNAMQWDLGGPFYSQKWWVEKVVTTPWSGSWFYRGSYSGDLAVDVGGDPKATSGRTPWNVPVATDSQVLLGLGGTAISRCKPTNPNASLAQSLIELRRDGLPSVPGASTRRDGVRGLASDHLNYEFGIRPLINDIKSVRNSLVNAESILQQYRRDAGRSVRRKYQFPISKTTTISTTENTQPWPLFESYAYTAALGRTTKTVRTEKSYHFSGCFSYFRHADIDSRLAWVQGKIREANNLLGIAPTPEVFWDTLPWSWFIDWFTNVGDIISNVSQIITDGLVVNWAYLTEVIRVETEFAQSGCIMNNGVRPAPVTLLVYESKRRVRSTPFGFGFDMTTLSGRQLAILASLGISRGGQWKAM